MAGVSDADRHDLIEDVLASGCADPNFPPIYWGGPAVHACFEGDVIALEALRVAGCDLRQRVEWLLQERPLFSLVHAAAFNGQVEILRYLRRYMPPSFFREVDAMGSNPLHTLLESSRDMDTARFLLEVGVDGFAMNNLGRSPLSMAVEVLPELALELLNTKSRFEYRWWGNDLYWYSFTGIVLPLGRTQEASALAEAARSEPPPTPPATATPMSGADVAGRSGSRRFPLTFRDQKGLPASLEDLILRHERKELLETPVMLDLIERKWRFFAGEAYRTRILSFGAMLASVFFTSAGEAGTPLFAAAVASTAATWALFFKDQTDRLANKLGAPVGDAPLAARLTKDVTFFDAVDFFILSFVPVVTTYRVAELAGLDVPGLLALPQDVNAVLATLDGALQVSLALSMLNLFALFRVLGPLLITVVQMVSDALRFAAILGIVLLGYANGFYSLVHFGASEQYLASLDFDYSYTSIVTQMSLWLAGSPDLSLIEPLAPNIQLGGSVLFWSFVITSYFVLLNLLIAIFNTTYERIQTNSFAEWLFIRLRTTLEFEADKTLPGVREYYDQLEARDNQRAVKGRDDLQR